MKNLITRTTRPYLHLLPSPSFLTAVNSRRRRTYLRPKSIRLRSSSPSCRLYEIIRGMNALTNPSSSAFRVRSRLARLLPSFAFAVLIMNGGPLHAADVTWNNGAGSFNWNLTDLNWSTGQWNNASIDNAFFGGTGVGAITVNAPINVSTLNFSTNGYSLGGTGPFTFVRGTSLNHLITGNIGVGSGATVPINTAINSSIGI